MKLFGKKNPMCPGCETDDYVTPSKVPNAKPNDWWCGRCHHWFKAGK